MSGNVGRYVGGGSPYPMVAFASGRDIEAALEDPEVSTIVESQSENFHRLNVKDAMSNLNQIGQLLRLAYAGSKGFPCSNEIVTILLDYQQLITNSDLACGKFVSTCIGALKSHKFALELTNKDKVPLALRQLSKCERDAGQMIIASQQLVTDSEKLCNQAKKAMQTATSDETISTAKKSEIKKTLSDLAEREASLSSRTKDLQAMINDAKQREVQALREAQAAEKKNLFLSVIGAVGKIITTVVPKIGGSNESKNNPIPAMTNAVQTLIAEKTKIQSELNTAEEQLAVKRVKFETSESKEVKAQLQEEIVLLELSVRKKQEALKGQGSALEEAQKNLKAKSENATQRASEAGQKKLELQREQLEANADLAGSVAKLKGLTQETDDLSKAIASLEITIKTLGKVTTVFTNTRMFWEGVQMHCQALTRSIEDCKEIADEPDLRGEFIEAIQASGYSWLALGQINWTASLAITDVRLGVNKVVCNLPTKEEATAMIEPLTVSMLSQIEEERKKIVTYMNK